MTNVFLLLNKGNQLPTQEKTLMKFKPIEELTFTDDFMFGYVLPHNEKRRTLQRTSGKTITHQN